MALSKTIIKKLEKHKEKYYIIVPFTTQTERLLYDYTWYTSLNEYSVCILDKIEYNNIKNLILKDDERFITKKEYNDMLEVINDFRKKNIKISGLRDPKGVEEI